MNTQFLTIDLENRRLKYSIVTDSLDVMKSGKLEIISVDEPDALYSPIFTLVNEFKNEIKGVVLTMPGVIDSQKGIAYSGGMYTWIKNEPIAIKIYEETGVKTIIVNDAKAATYAEIGYGSLKKVNSGVMVMLLGTGIGGSIVYNGQILNGEHFAAGEFSYMLGDYKNREEGQDMFALSMSVNSLVDIVKEYTHQENMNVMKILYGIHNQEPDYVAAVNIYCTRLAAYLYNIQCVCDVSRIVMSGTISEEKTFMDLLRNAIQVKFDQALYHNIFMPEIVSATFHEDARKFGGIYLFHQLEKEGII